MSKYASPSRGRSSSRSSGSTESAASRLETRSATCLSAPCSRGPSAPKSVSFPRRASEPTSVNRSVRSITCIPRCSVAKSAIESRSATHSATWSRVFGHTAFRSYALVAEGVQIAAASLADRDPRAAEDIRTTSSDPGRHFCCARLGPGPGSAAGRLLIPAGDLLPVDDVPPGGEVVGAAVLVLEVVGVLPDVDAEQRHLAVADRAVLVRRRQHGETGAVPDEPRPAAAEALDAGVVHRRLQLVEAAEHGLDRRPQLPVRVAAAVRAHDLPEERVVRVPASVVAHGGTDRLGEKL